MSFWTSKIMLCLSSKRCVNVMRFCLFRFEFVSNMKTMFKNQRGMGFKLPSAEKWKPNTLKKSMWKTAAEKESLGTLTFDVLSFFILYFLPFISGKTIKPFIRLFLRMHWAKPKKQMQINFKKRGSFGSICTTDITVNLLEAQGQRIEGRWK